MSNHYWNYRVMRHIVGNSEPDYFSFHEVHYDGEEVLFWSQKEMGSAPYGEDLNELKSDLEKMAKAPTLPILDFHTGKEIK